MTKLKACRMEKGLRQCELARRLKVKIPTISVMEKKGIYDTRTAVKYSKALEVDPLFLLEGISK